MTIVVNVITALGAQLSSDVEGHLRLLASLTALAQITSVTRSLGNGRSWLLRSRSNIAWGLGLATCRSATVRDVNVNVNISASIVVNIDVVADISISGVVN